MRFSFIVLCMALFASVSASAQSGTLKGVIVDQKTKEAIIGATIQVAGTSIGTATGVDGSYALKVKPGTYDFLVRCVGYKDVVKEGVKVGRETVLDIEMEEDVEMLGDVDVTAKKKLESERVLQMERQQSIVAIENIGAKEMSIKGVSNVQEGVKKITGISIASAGQLIVRGLGDRYSTTTLNGLPIASPNPDNKLIPLDLFPSSTVQNITVSKVYEASTFADYAGAHIDISTKTNVGSDFFSVGISTGTPFNTIGKDFYHSDRKGGLWKTGNLDHNYLDMPFSDFESVVRDHDIFGTTFEIGNKTALPDISGNIGWGKTFGRFNMLLSFGMGNERQVLSDAFVRQLTAQGSVMNRFDYNKFTTKLNMAGLAGLNVSLREEDFINYSFFYARNAVDEYMDRTGFDSEQVSLKGSNSVFHAYTLINNQLYGHHELGKHWELDWAGSYGKTGSDEPDRRQVMFRYDEKTGALSLFRLNQQETMRYFGELNEEEIVGDVKVVYNFGESNRVRVGGAYRRKTRDFQCANFFYDLENLAEPTITDIYHTDDYLNFENIANGSIDIQRSYQLRNQYNAESDSYAAFAEVDFYPVPALLINLGLRFEQVKQVVDYHDDNSMAQTSTLDKGDVFPALNVKYSFDEKSSLRFAASRTVTRPAFVEMAPFLYTESYGGASLRGNADIQNGYNVNVDLRYDYFSKRNDNMFSAALYFKYLQDPIERVQGSEGGATVHTFRNSESGVAMGIELEARKELFKDFRVGVNGSYMYTDVKLPSGGGIYTDNQRALQGASPFLVNADVSYAPYFKNENQMVLALVYNVQGPRIHAVGIYELGDNKQLTLHTLDFVGSYSFHKNWNVSLSVKDLLNSKVRFRQDVPKIDDKIDVEQYRPGTNIGIGISYKF